MVLFLYCAYWLIILGKILVKTLTAFYYFYKIDIEGTFRGLRITCTRYLAKIRPNKFVKRQVSKLGQPLRLPINIFISS